MENKELEIAKLKMECLNIATKYCDSSRMENLIEKANKLFDFIFSSPQKPS